MIRTGRSGGLIGLSSFIVLEDRRAASEHSLRTASVREALKEGVQSLYADPADALKKYKDFDLAAAMADQKGKVLWVRARAIDADTVNANGDYFSKEELLKEVDFKGGKVPAYKTFEGVPIYTNHKNDDIEQAKGKVVYAEWDDEENCVYCTFFVDEEAYPDIARGIRQGYMHDVSMGCQVESGECSMCGHVATDTKDYCDCLKTHKGKRHPRSGDIVYEKNFGLKFIELSVVGDGAFDLCEIEEIYDVDEVLDKARELGKKAGSLHSSIRIATASMPNDLARRRVMEEFFRVASDTANTAVRLAQQAGTLVGGQVLSQEGADQNTTVAAILHFLGIDPKSGLNVLDMLNLALNFLEVAVLNMFARKDNVDLSHVSKITKSMSDLQATMQDMIDDGIDMSGQRQPPLNQGQIQQGAPQQPQAPLNAPPGAGQQQQQTNQNYVPAGTVGRMVGPLGDLFAPSGNSLGGGVTASTERSPLLVWASKDKKKREVFASVQEPERTPARKKSGALALGESLASFAQSLGINAPEGSPNKDTNRVTKDHTPTHTNFPKRAGGDDTQMDIFKRFASERRKQTAAMVSMDFKVEDGQGNRIVLSSADSSVAAYHKGTRVAWEPQITDSQLDMMEQGQGALVAAQMLKDFSRHVATASWKPHHDEDVREHEIEHLRHNDPDDEGELFETQLENAGDYKRRHPKGDKIREELIEERRKGTPDMGEVREETLDDEAGLYGRRVDDDSEGDVREVLIDEARKGYPQDVIENQLKVVRKQYGPDATPNLVTTATVNALSNAVVAARLAPEEVVEAAQALAGRKDLADLIALAALGTKHRTREASRRKLHKIASLEPTPALTVLHALGNEITEKVLAADLAEGVRAVAAETEPALFAVRHATKERLGDSFVSEAAPVRTTLSRADRLRASIKSYAAKIEGNIIDKTQLRAAMSAMARAAEDMGAHPSEVVNAVASMDEDVLLAAVEEARSPKAVEARKLLQLRKQVHAATRFAGVQDIEEATVGALADYTLHHKLSSVGIVEAAKRLASQPNVAERLVTNALRQLREASITVTDEESTTRRIVCRTEDLGGLDPKDENFKTAFREKAIQILADNGYQVDPATFALTDVTVSESGDITASVTTRFSKTFKADATPSGLSATELAGENDPMASQRAEVVEEPALPETILTAAAAKARAERRAGLINKYAQMSPGMGGMMGGMGMGMGAQPMADPMGGAPGGDGGLGMSGMTVPTEAGGAPVDEPADTDAMPEPGSKKAWGTICPQCGSENVDIANGEGNCQDCGAQLRFTYNVEVLPSNDKDKEGEEAAPADDLGLDDMGLGAATAPQPDMGAGAPPAGGAAPAGGGAMPPMGAAASNNAAIMIRTSYLADSDVFIRTAQKDFDRTSERRLPVGMICPNCGNRHAEKVKNITHCFDCGTMALSEVKPVRGVPGKVEASISWLV